jgi:membrane associated rhomboid family serine protease
LYGRGYSGGGGGLGFGPPVTPPVIKQILIANAVVYFAQIIGLVGMVFAASPIEFWKSGYLWQPFTYMWMHSPQSMFHIVGNMFTLWMFGSQVALVWGPQRFLRFYLICGVGAGLLIVSVPMLLLKLGGDSPAILSMVNAPTLGASGAVFGVLLAYSLTWPDRTIMLIFPPVAFRAIWLIPLLFLMEFQFGAANVSHTGHLGGVLVGWLLLRSQGDAQGLPSLEQIRWRWRRWRMRRRLRAVKTDASRNDDRPYYH